MPSLWNSLFIAWLAWCTVASASSVIRVPLAPLLAGPLAAVLAAVLGVWLAWQAWRQSPGVNDPRAWLRPQEWSATSRAGIGVGAVYIVLDTLRLFAGRLTSVFGIYIVVALMVSYVPRVPGTASPAVTPPA
jgi:hypothetical protein